MADSNNVFGPYTPQETDRIATALQAHSIPFEIHKDEADEKKFTTTDFQSIVTRAEYRTETYLAQIFYFTVEDAYRRRYQDTLLEIGLAPQDVGAAPSDIDMALPAQEQWELKVAAEEKRQQKRLVAQLLAALMIGGILYAFFFR